MFAVALLPILLGIVVGWGGFLGLRAKLPRDKGAGVRTAATLRSDEAFRLANRVAGIPTIAGGAVGIVGGVAGLLMPSSAGLITATVLGLLGMFALVAGGGVLGHRAAETVPAPTPVAGGCGSCDATACLSGQLAAATPCQPAQETPEAAAKASSTNASPTE